MYRLPKVWSIASCHTRDHRLTVCRFGGIRRRRATVAIGSLIQVQQAILVRSWHQTGIRGLDRQSLSVGGALRRLRTCRCHSRTVRQLETMADTHRRELASLRIPGLITRVFSRRTGATRCCLSVELDKILPRLQAHVPADLSRLRQVVLTAETSMLRVR